MGSVPGGKFPGTGTMETRDARDKSSAIVIQPESWGTLHTDDPATDHPTSSTTSANSGSRVAVI